MIDRLHNAFLTTKPGGMEINYMTKPDVAEYLCDLALLEPGMRVLEPSAGTGILAEIARSRGCDVECVEENPEFAAVLRQEGFKTVCADFSQWQAAHLYERVLMNPPFEAENLEDLLHIRKAWQWLANDGVLVSVVAKQTPLQPRFLKWVHARCLRLEIFKLPADAYDKVQTATIRLRIRQQPPGPPNPPNPKRPKEFA